MFRTSKKRMLLFSFLVGLKRTDPKAFLLVVICITIQLFFTFIKLEATPFVLFGMFSEKVMASDTFSTIQVLINDRTLESYNPPFRETQLLEINAGNYIGMKRNNQNDILKTRVETGYPFIYNSVFYPFVARQVYNTPKAQNDFKAWFKEKCNHIADIDNAVVKIVETKYLLNRTTLYPSPLKHEILEVF
ncbi:hypothetical protein [Flavitalea sp.]|nr:hypothetical protein [Flavitalea sp.]